MLKIISMLKGLGVGALSKIGGIGITVMLGLGLWQFCGFIDSFIETPVQEKNTDWSGWEHDEEDENDNAKETYVENDNAEKTHAQPVICLHCGAPLKKDATACVYCGCLVFGGKS